jgi:hypothetical protein
MIGTTVMRNADISFGTSHMRRKFFRILIESMEMKRKISEHDDFPENRCASVCMPISHTSSAHLQNTFPLLMETSQFRSEIIGMIVLIVDAHLLVHLMCVRANVYSPIFIV